MAIGLWILPYTWILLRDNKHIFLQDLPHGFDHGATCAAMAEIACLKGVHDLPLTSVAGGDTSLTAHFEIVGGEGAEAVRRAMTVMLEAQFAIHHVSLRPEPVPCDEETALHR